MCWMNNFISFLYVMVQETALFIMASQRHCSSTKPSNMPICVRIQQCTMWVEFWSLNLQSFIQRPHGYTSVCNSWPPLQLFSVQPIWLFCSGIHTFHFFWLVKDTLDCADQLQFPRCSKQLACADFHMFRTTSLHSRSNPTLSLTVCIYL